MAIVGMIFWWYGAGWRLAAHRVAQRLAGLIDYFSIDLLVKTLFSPFRQIASESVKGPIGVQMRVMLDKLISRIIGGIVRLMMLCIGVTAILTGTLIGLLYLVLWGMLPLLPVVGFVLALIGWIPWNNL